MARVTTDPRLTSPIITFDGRRFDTAIRSMIIDALIDFLVHLPIIMLKSLLLQPVTKRHTERAILQTNPKHLFRIITDVDRYAEFLPLCTHAKILQRQGSYFDATMTVGLPPLFTEEFVSRTKFDSDKMIVETKSFQSKLFENLSSRWELTKGDNKQQTKVDFWMEMTVSDTIVVSALDRVLKEVAGRQVAAFEQRCKDILDADEDD